MSKRTLTQTYPFLDLPSERAWQMIRNSRRYPLRTIDYWPGELELPEEPPLTADELASLLHVRVADDE